jgi:F-type H+-transporting ATPase subunit b
MIIDWFTLLAQAINFLILVWLMRRYLYHPILNAIDARERLTAKILADAGAKESAARQSGDLFKSRNDEFDRSASERMKTSVEEVAKERLRLLEEVRMAADKLRTDHQRTARHEMETLHQSIIMRVQKEVVAATRKTLADLASTGLEEQLDAVFIRRLQLIDAAAKDVITTALRTSSGPALVRSAFALSGEQQTRMRQALGTAFSCESIRFEVVPELVCGIEFLANGQKVAWNIAEHITALENSLGELLDTAEQRTTPSPHPPAAEATAVAKSTASAAASHQQ